MRQRAKTSYACQSHDFVAIIAGFEAPESAFGTFTQVVKLPASTAASRLLSTFLRFRAIDPEGLIINSASD
jgi:hypothetical protein